MGDGNDFYPLRLVAIDNSKRKARQHHFARAIASERTAQRVGFNLPGDKFYCRKEVIAQAGNTVVVEIYAPGQFRFGPG